MTQIQKKFGRRRMKWMMATIRRPIDHHENMKNRNDPIAKSHYSMRGDVGTRAQVQGTLVTPLALGYGRSNSLRLMARLEGTAHSLPLIRIERQFVGLIGRMHSEWLCGAYNRRTNLLWFHRL